MFGLRTTFPYLECGRCGCVQLLEVPPAMDNYYPKNYYSFQPHGRLQAFLRHQWSAYSFGRFRPLGWMLARLTFSNQAMEAVRRTKVAKTARILDVGCGSGHLIKDLSDLGFRNVEGVDPYLETDVTWPNGPTVHKKQLAEMPDEYDLIMLHHSFEHMDAPQQVMHDLARRLRPGGRVLLRIPVAGSFAWKHYGVNWVNLDAPRHFFLHTEHSVRILATSVGLEIETVLYEGTEYQFWYSEQYARDIPMHDPRFRSATSLKLLAARMLNPAYRRKSEELNRTKQGDQGCFTLVRSGR